MLESMIDSITPSYWVYQYRPAFAGQASNEKDDEGTAMYLFATYDIDVISCPNKGSYGIHTKSNAKKELLFTTEIPTNCCSMMMTINDRSHQVVAKVGQSNVY